MIFIGETYYALPVIEIIPPSGEPMFFMNISTTDKPGNMSSLGFSYEEKSKMAEIASLVHQVIDCDHYSRTDFIVRDGEVYFLEVNTLPGLTDQSLFFQSSRRYWS